MGQAQESVVPKPARRVLIIDDEDYVRQYMSLMIGSWGFDVIANGKIEATDLAKLTRSDLIFIGMMMPGVDGIQVLEALSRQGVKSSIVLMSGSHADILGTAERIAKQQGLRVAGVLRKPFRSRELRRILEGKLQEARTSERQLRSSEMSIEDLLEGLERHEFDTYLQPIIELATGRLVGHEALARWNSEKFSLVSPDRFIQVAARNGILPRLTQQIAARALDYAGALKARGVPSIISINIGVEDLVDDKLPEKLTEMVTSRDLWPHSLIVELTESSATLNETKMLEILARMRLKGIDLAIDDFGTSYSSLERLSIVPFTLLKIDIRFIQDIATNVNARAIVQSAIKLAKRLNLTTVAEGIENEIQLRILTNLGCRWGQGFLFAPPMEFREALNWAIERNAAGGGEAGTAN